MTTYVAIPDGDIDLDSPVNQPLMTALRDNPIAMFEGDASAPRLLYAALGAIVAGTVAASIKPTSTAGFSTTVILSELGLLQTGSIRLSFGQRSTGGQNVTAVINRWRNSGTTALVTYTTTSATNISRSLDITVQPGDTFYVSHTGASASSSILDDITYSTTGAIVWPFAPYTSVV